MGEVTHLDQTETEIDDDGIDLMNLGAADVIESLTVLNGETAQAPVLV